MARLSWEDIAGGAKGSPAPAGQAEIITELPAAGGGDGGFSLAGANTWLQEAREFIQNIDEFAGLFLQLRGAQAAQGGQGQALNPAAMLMLPQDAPRELQAASMQAAPAPASVKDEGATPAVTPSAGPSPDQVLGLMKKIMVGEGDIPLSKLLSGIEHQEPWLIKYALEMMADG